MLRIILFLSFSIFIVQLSWGQAKQPSLGILKLNAPELEDHKAIKINKYIESAFYKSRRFNIVSRQLNESIQQEREQQKENIDNIVIEQGRAVGADYIVKGFAKLSKKKIYKSSPKSRAPVQQRTGYGSKSRTSPRTSTTSTPKKESSTSKRSAPKAKPSTKAKTTAKTSPRKSPRSSSSSSKDQTTSRPPKTTPTTSARDRSKTATTKQVEAKTSPKPKESNSKNQSQAPQLSTDIDQIYTSTYISFTIKIINVKTGVIAAEENYKGSINGVTEFVNKIVKKTFPYEFKIIEVTETKGDKKAKHILLDGGTKHGIIKGTYLKAFEVSEENVDGKILKREIQVGQLYVKRVDTGGNFSLCTIYKGKKEILKKIKAGTTLYCKLRY